MVSLFGLSLLWFYLRYFHVFLWAFHPNFGSEMHLPCMSKNIALCKHEEPRTDRTWERNLKVQSSTDGQHCYGRFGDKDIHFYPVILRHDQSHSISTVTVHKHPSALEAPRHGECQISGKLQIGNVASNSWKTFRVNKIILLGRTVNNSRNKGLPREQILHHR